MWQSFSDEPLAVCPQVHDGDTEACGAAVRKVFSKVGISFKGDGFYTNDHGARSRGSKSKSESPADTASDGSADKAASKSSSNGSSSESSAAGSGSEAPAKSASAAKSASKVKDASPV